MFGILHIEGIFLETFSIRWGEGGLCVRLRAKLCEHLNKDCTRVLDLDFTNFVETALIMP